MTVKAIFLDLDSTLANTEAADRIGYSAAKRAALSLLSQSDWKDVKEGYRALLAAAPDDPGGQLGVDAGRIGLWRQAMIDAGLAVHFTGSVQ